MRLDELGGVDRDGEAGGEFGGTCGFGFTAAVGEEDEFDGVFREKLEGGGGGGDGSGAVHEDAINAALIQQGSEEAGGVCEGGRGWVGLLEGESVVWWGLARRGGRSLEEPTRQQGRRGWTVEQSWERLEEGKT